MLKTWPGAPFLDVLRPGPGETVQLALLSAYSADLPSLGAALLATIGRDNDTGRGPGSAFADAVQAMRGRFRTVIQGGRLAPMRRAPRVSAVLDQFVREVDFDEARRSWHAKAALVKVASEDAVHWRLWIGSRNLTECVNYDTGLFLVSTVRGGTHLPGVEGIGRSLAARAALPGVTPAALASELERLRWRAPVGVQIEAIAMTDGESTAEAFIPPEDTQELTVIGPFLDSAFLKRVSGPAPARRRLLSTVRELERVGEAASGFDEILAIDAPFYPAADPPDEDESLATGEDEELGRGLHAKIILARSRAKPRLWIGSANATMRGWSGRNVEIMVEMTLDDSTAEGIEALLGAARPINASDLGTTAEAEDAEQELERARAAVAAGWDGRLRLEGERLVLLHPGGTPHPADASFSLEVATLTGPLQPWPRGVESIDFGPVPAEDRSELIRLRVGRAGDAVAWFQRAPADPPFGEQRDHAAFARLLGPRGFFLWLAGQLGDLGDPNDGDWTVDPVERERAFPDEPAPAWDPELPTMEAILAAWSRDPPRFDRIAKRVEAYLPTVLALARSEDPASARLLLDFRKLWRTLRAGLARPPR